MSVGELDRQTKQNKRQTETEIGKKTHKVRQTDRKTLKQIQKQRDKEPVRQADKWTDRHSRRQSVMSCRRGAKNEIIQFMLLITMTKFFTLQNIQ